MVKFFFNRFSKMVFIMEVVGLLLLATNFFRLFSEKNPVKTLFFIIVLFEYSFIKFCAVKKWYSNAPRYSGIELQFKKATVPTNYIVAMFSALALFGIPIFSYVIAAFFLLVIAHVNVILIYFYLRDKDQTPVNYFTDNHDYVSLTTQCPH